MHPPSDMGEWWAFGFKFVRCPRCNEAYQKNAGHFCKPEKLDAEIDEAIQQVEGYLAHSKEAEFLTYLAERGII